MYTDLDNRSCSFLLVDGNSTLNVAGIEAFAEKVKLAECGVPYSAISIMGPQSSGKSTLLNHLFGTNFREMDASKGKGQTTEGIWLAKYPEVKSCTLVMDLEGSDGRERGQDGTKFEKQAALFAFAISDIVIINMWSHDVGRMQAASTPLLKTVFEAMRKLKLRDSKTTLWFVIRDRTRMPLEELRKIIQEDMEQICKEVEGTPLTEFFKVKFADLCNYETNEEEFKKEVANLKDQLLGELDGDGRDKRPTSGFSFSVKNIWEKIKENKDLDLPAQKILVATFRCEEIAKKTFVSFDGNKDWYQIQRDVKSAPVKDFGKRLNSILEELLRGYDEDSMYFDEIVRAEKRKELKEKILQRVEPAHQAMLEHIYSRTLSEFKEAFPKFGGQAVRDCIKRFMTQFDELCRDAAINQANWDSSELRARLRRDIDAHVAKVLPDAMDEYLKRDKKNWKAAVSAKTIVHATGAALGGVGAAVVVGVCIASGVPALAGVAAASVVGLFAACSKRVGMFFADDSEEARSKKNKNRKSTEVASALAGVGVVATTLGEKSLYDA